MTTWCRMRMGKCLSCFDHDIDLGVRKVYATHTVYMVER